MIISTPKDYSKLSTAELVSVVKGEGKDRQSSYSTFVKYRNLTPEIDAKSFNQIWDNVTSSSGRVSKEIEFKPTHVLTSEYGEPLKIMLTSGVGGDYITYITEYGATGSTPKDYIKNLVPINLGTVGDPYHHTVGHAPLPPKKVLPPLPVKTKPMSEMPLQEGRTYGYVSSRVGKYTVRLSDMIYNGREWVWPEEIARPLISVGFETDKTRYPSAADKQNGVIGYLEFPYAPPSREAMAVMHEMVKRGWLYADASEKLNLEQAMSGEYDHYYQSTGHPMKVSEGDWREYERAGQPWGVVEDYETGMAFEENERARQTEDEALVDRMLEADAKKGAEKQFQKDRSAIIRIEDLKPGDAVAFTDESQVEKWGSSYLHTGEFGAVVSDDGKELQFYDPYKGKKVHPISILYNFRYRILPRWVKVSATIEKVMWETDPDLRVKSEITGKTLVYKTKSPDDAKTRRFGRGEIRDIYVEDRAGRKWWAMGDHKGVPDPTLAADLKVHPGFLKLRDEIKNHPDKMIKTLTGAMVELVLPPVVGPPLSITDRKSVGVWQDPDIGLYLSDAGRIEANRGGDTFLKAVSEAGDTGEWDLSEDDQLALYELEMGEAPGVAEEWQRETAGWEDGLERDAWEVEHGAFGDTYPNQYNPDLEKDLKRDREMERKAEEQFERFAPVGESKPFYEPDEWTLDKRARFESESEARRLWNGVFTLKTKFDACKKLGFRRDFAKERWDDLPLHIRTGVIEDYIPSRSWEGEPTKADVSAAVAEDERKFQEIAGAPPEPDESYITADGGPEMDLSVQDTMANAKRFWDDEATKDTKKRVVKNQELPKDTIKMSWDELPHKDQVKIHNEITVTQFPAPGEEPDPFETLKPGEVEAVRGSVPRYLLVERTAGPFRRRVAPEDIPDNFTAMDLVTGRMVVGEALKYTEIEVFENDVRTSKEMLELLKENSTGEVLPTGFVNTISGFNKLNGVLDVMEAGDVVVADLQGPIRSPRIRKIRTDAQRRGIIDGGEAAAERFLSGGSIVEDGADWGRWEGPAVVREEPTTSSGASTPSPKSPMTRAPPLPKAPASALKDQPGRRAWIAEIATRGPAGAIDAKTTAKNLTTNYAIWERNKRRYDFAGIDTPRDDIRSTTIRGRKKIWVGGNLKSMQLRAVAGHLNKVVEHSITLAELRAIGTLYLEVSDSAPCLLHERLDRKNLSVITIPSKYIIGEGKSKPLSEALIVMGLVDAVTATMRKKKIPGRKKRLEAVCRMSETAAVAAAKAGVL